MRTLFSYATVCVFGAAMAALLPACGSTDDTGGGTAGAPGAAGSASTAGSPGAAGSTGTAGGGSALVGDAARGLTQWNKQACGSCHGSMGEGGLAPNITKSAAGGIGAFTQAQFHAAVREAKNKEGGKLCVAMAAYDTTQLSEQDIADLYALQQSFPAVDTPAASPLYCQSACCTGEHK